MRFNFIPHSVSGVVATAAFGLALVVQGSAFAAPKTVKEIANYKGSDRQAVLEAGAKKEGVVQIYTTGTQTKSVMAAFGKKYPYLKVEAYRAGSTTVTRRLMEEYRAGRHTVDVVDLSVGAQSVIRDAGHLQPYYSPHFAKIQKDSIEAGRHWAHNYHSAVGLGYNTKEIAPADVPNTYEDLLDPKWKDKMVLSGRAGTIGNFVGSLVLTMGEKFVYALGKQNLKVFAMSGRALSSMVVSGEVPLSPEVYSSHMQNSKSKGANVDWKALGPVFGQIGSSAVAVKAPHPHAALLYNDFMLSREGQKMMQKLGYVSPRTDLTSRSRPKKLLNLYARPNYLKEFEQWGNLAKKAFGKARKRPKKKK